MKRKGYQIGVLETLAGLEEATRDLYKAYADKLRDFEDFWLSIASDEASHSRWIRALGPLVENGTVDFDENRFKRFWRSGFNEPAFFMHFAVAFYSEDC